ncbi:hypothetical protein [Pseudomonas panipatensis]|jgi:hypothetical protein|uniref:DUF3077 domain-containing protein n=1 Tax=Pseudomonas panipatensis TaxID=428992 RepID=A0A1G8BJE8_9PSED|nr:hypothetical protein [Pseudomonas panipatensis]SDH33288.1 hypothetical protein SAMN05216272_10192 [Pseudomonas panipatensis]SMP71211.1 hypothetical protein SAMN06295951_11073 [Pseudomonas panipatensis]
MPHAHTFKYLDIDTAPGALDLFDAAQARHSALLDMLQLLAGARDLGAPSAEVLAGAFTCLQLLAADSERLYATARRLASEGR